MFYYFYRYFNIAQRYGPIIIAHLRVILMSSSRLVKSLNNICCWCYAINNITANDLRSVSWPHMGTSKEKTVSRYERSPTVRCVIVSSAREHCWFLRLRFISTVIFMRFVLYPCRRWLLRHFSRLQKDNGLTRRDSVTGANLMSSFILTKPYD